MPARIFDDIALEQEEGAAQPPKVPRAEQVVVSGLSGRLPESDNIAEFREHLMKAEDMVTETSRRWEPGKNWGCFKLRFPT